MSKNEEKQETGVVEVITKDEMPYNPVRLQDLAREMTQQLIKKVYLAGQADAETTEKALEAGTEVMREELHYRESSAVEQLLIEAMIIEQLRVQSLQLTLTELTTRSKPNAQQIKQTDTLLSAAMRRFEQATGMLEKNRAIIYEKRKYKNLK